MYLRVVSNHKYGYYDINTLYGSEWSAYCPMDSQNGKILASSYRWLWAQGSYNFPAFNSYIQAVQQCTSLCDSNLTCLPFKGFTAFESDFIKCIPYIYSNSRTILCGFCTDGSSIFRFSQNLSDFIDLYRKYTVSSIGSPGSYDSIVEVRTCDCT